MPVSIRHQNRTCHKTQFILMFCVVLLLPLSQLQLLDATRCHCTVRRAGSLLFFFFFFHSNSPRSEQRIASHRIAPLPPYLSVLFNAQQRSDVSCARFLKCTIIPGPGPAPSPAFRIASHRVVSCRGTHLAKGCMYEPFVRIRGTHGSSGGECSEWSRGGRFI